MNPDLQTQLADMLAKLTSVAGDATQFAKEQIPPLVQEKITLGRIEGALGICVACIALWVAFVLVRYCHRLHWDVDGGRSSDGTLRESHGEIIHAFILSVLLACGGAAILLASADVTLMAWFAPRLYVVEWLKSMVTK